MFRRLSRFTLRRLLIAVALICCALTVGIRARDIHRAAVWLDEAGGNVWCGDVLYSGSGYGYPDRTDARLRRDRAEIVAQILTGTQTDLWVCYVPDDRDQFAAQLRRLNPRTISFDVIGPGDRAWIRQRFPTAKLRAISGLERKTSSRPTHARVQQPKALSAWIAEQEKAADDVDLLSSSTSLDVAALNPDQIAAAMESSAAQLELRRGADPQFWYRVDRYRDIFCCPTQGEMGRVLDRESGRIITLPWPK